MRGPLVTWISVGLVMAMLAGPAAAQTPLRFGAVSYVKSETRASLEPIAKFLDDQLPQKVQLVLYPGYNDILVALASDSLDLALLTPVVYLTAQENLGVQPLAYGVYPSGKFTYQGVVLAKKDSAVKKLEDLKGKKVGFVDLFSASGYVVPKLMLEEAGIGAKSVEDVFLGNHLDVLKAVDAGEVVAGATYDLVFAQADLKQKLEDYQVLAKSDPIPTDVMVAGPKTSAELTAKLKDLLLSFHYLRRQKPEYQKGFYSSFIPPDDSLFTGLKAMHRKVLGTAE